MTLVPSELLERACAATGLDDLRRTTPSGEGLDVYCASAHDEAALNDLGRVAVQTTIVDALVNRLRVVDHRRRHPEVADEDLGSPLVVIGMFRAGTTLLGTLLDQDPANRSLLRWESGDSVPPPTPATFRHGPRVDAARLANDLLEQLNPTMRAIHHEEADGPTECIAVMAQAFTSLSWEAITNVPSYGEWLLATDHRPAYRYHHDVLQVLQSGGVRGRWTLKSPHHALALDALTAVYPDARLVLLHRDPVKLCGSVCSLVTELSGCFTDADHAAYIADHWVSVLETSIERIDRFRATHPAHPIVDVRYADLVRDPVGTVAAIGEAVGTPVGDEARARMQAHLDAHPRGSLGTHTYDLSRFGLDAGAVRERFAGYVERYEIPVEG